MITMRYMQYYCFVLASMDVVSIIILVIFCMMFLFSAMTTKSYTTVNKYYNGKLVDSRTYQNSILDNISVPSPNPFRSLLTYVFVVHILAAVVILFFLPKYWIPAYESIPDWKTVFGISIILILLNLLLSFSNMITARWSFPLSLTVVIFRIFLMILTSPIAFRINNRAFFHSYLTHPGGLVLFSRQVSKGAMDIICLIFIILWFVLLLACLILPTDPQRYNLSDSDVARKYFTMLANTKGRNNDAQTAVIGINLFVIIPLLIASVIILFVVKSPGFRLMTPIRLMWLHLFIISAVILVKNIFLFFRI